MRVVFPQLPLSTPPPSPATSCLSYVGSWVPWAGFCGQEPFSLSSVGEALPPSHHSLLCSPLPWAGVAWEEGESGGGSWCAGVNVCYKGTCLLAFSSPSVPLPTYPCPGVLSITPGFVCASSQGRRWSQMAEVQKGRVWRWQTGFVPLLCQGSEFCICFLFGVDSYHLVIPNSLHLNFLSSDSEVILKVIPDFSPS